MKNIFMDQLHLHMFKKHGELEMEFEDVTEVFGRNSSGKSTLADAFCFVFTGTTFWGNKFVDPIMNSGNLCWVNFSGEVNGQRMEFRRLLERNGESLKTLVTEEVTVDKQIFLSLVNPRYFVSLSPAEAKEVLLKVSNLTTSSLPIVFPESRYLIEEIEDEIGSEDTRLSVKWELVNDYRQKVKARVAEIVEEKAMTEGKVQAYEQSMKFFKDNGLAVPEELQNYFEAFSLTASLKTVKLGNEKDNLKKTLKSIEQYRNLLAKLAVKAIEAELPNVKISLEDNGKDVFVVTFQGRDYKGLSNSEQLLTGLEIVNAIACVSDTHYPCWIDNAEALQSQDLELYPEISQFVVLNVSDVDLSTYENGVLTNPVTRKTMARTRESLKPNVNILGGWGKEETSG